MGLKVQDLGFGGDFLGQIWDMRPMAVASFHASIPVLFFFFSIFHFQYFLVSSALIPSLWAFLVCPGVSGL